MDHSNVTQETEYLECQQQQVPVSCERGRAITQATLDEDYNLPEYKPDILKLIEEKGQVRIDESKVEPDMVRIRGALCFEILYRCAREDGSFGQLQGEIPFQEILRIEGAQEGDHVRIDAGLEDLSVGLINSRKLEVRGLVTLQAQLRQSCVSSLTTGLASDSGQIQTRYGEVELLELLGQKKDTSRFHTQLTLPSNKPEIEKILWQSLQPRGLESRLEEGLIHVSGELFVHMVYVSAQEPDQLQCLELAVPLDATVDNADADPELLSWVRIRLLNAQLEAEEDVDGEERLLELSAMLEVDATIWQERTLTLLEDAYGIRQELLGTSEPLTLQRLLMKNDSRFRLNEVLPLESADPVLQICSCVGDVLVEEVTPGQGELLVSGVLKLKLLYIAANDEMPLMTTEGTLPFREAVQVMGLQPEGMDISYELEAGIDQLTTALVDQGQVECKAQIRLAVMIFENQQINNLTRLECTPVDTQLLRQQPGMVGYITRPGDSLWDIARAYRVTVQQLMEQNGLADETLHPGDKLMIVKSM